MLALAPLLLASLAVPATHASLYITFPVANSKCAVQQPCQIKWVDSPAPPSAASLGETALDLVSGQASNLQLVQSLQGVADPSKATALTFTPSNTLSSSVQYAIRFTSRNNPSSPIFSTYFSITGGPATDPSSPTSSKHSLATSTNASSSPSTPSASSNASSTTPSSTSTSTSNSSAKPTSASSRTISLAWLTLALPLVCFIDL